MGFVAIARISFRDGFLEPGDAVPVEPGRNYDHMVHHGQIAWVDDERLARERCTELEAQLEELTAERDELTKRVAALEKAPAKRGKAAPASKPDEENAGTGQAS